MAAIFQPCDSASSLARKLYTVGIIRQAWSVGILHRTFKMNFLYISIEPFYAPAAAAHYAIYLYHHSVLQVMFRSSSDQTLVHCVKHSFEPCGIITKAQISSNSIKSRRRSIPLFQAYSEAYRPIQFCLFGAYRFFKRLICRPLSLRGSSSCLLYRAKQLSLE